MRRGEYHDYFFGMRSSNMTISKYRLAENLNKCRCQHAAGFHHDHAAGGEIPKTTFYPEAMARTINKCLYPAYVPAMLVLVPEITQKYPRSKRGCSKKTFGMTVKLKLTANPKHNSNFQDIQIIYDGIHLLLERQDWHRYEG